MLSDFLYLYYQTNGKTLLIDFPQNFHYIHSGVTELFELFMLLEVLEGTILISEPPISAIRAKVKLGVNLFPLKSHKNFFSKTLAKKLFVKVQNFFVLTMFPKNKCFV